jgi:hypothetical protein
MFDKEIVMLNNGVLSFSAPNNSVLGSQLVPGQVVRKDNSGNVMIVIGGGAGERIGDAVRSGRSNTPAESTLLGFWTDPDGQYHVYPIYSNREYTVIDRITEITA